MSELDLDAIEKDCGQTRGGYPVMAAIRTLEYVPQLIAEIRRLQADLDAVRELAGPDNESGIISTDALLHTIGTGESRLAELQAQIERVRGLHKRAHAVGTRTGLLYEDPCPECDGKKGTHDCGCWSDFDTDFVCAECHRLGSDAKGVYDYTYPCPTIQALGDENE